MRKLGPIKDDDACQSKLQLGSAKPNSSCAQRQRIAGADDVSRAMLGRIGQRMLARSWSHAPARRMDYVLLQQRTMKSCSTRWASGLRSLAAKNKSAATIRRCVYGSSGGDAVEEMGRRCEESRKGIRGRGLCAYRR